MNLHPDVLAYFASVASEFPPPGTIPTAAEARALHQRLAAKIGPGREVKSVRNFTVPGPRGAIRVRMYRDGEGGSQPGLIYLHGGGWIGGDLDTHDVLCRELALGAQCAVIAVDYCLAPEHKFPEPFEDCLAACSHVLEHATDYGLDPNRIAIGGDSAGGNFAAGVVQAICGRGGPKPIFQLLIYPATDLRLSTPAFDVMQPPAFTAAEAAWCLDHYLTSFADVRDVRASPALALDLSGLPAALVITVEFDALRDDGEAYALALARAGVPVQLRRYPRLTHGFLSMPPSFGVTAAGIADVCRALRNALLES